MTMAGLWPETLAGTGTRTLQAGSSNNRHQQETLKKKGVMAMIDWLQPPGPHKLQAVVEVPLGYYAEQ